MRKIQDEKSALIASSALETKALTSIWCGIRVVDTNINVVRVGLDEALRRSGILVNEFHEAIGRIRSLD